jgi:NDP-sugar pyrophosphorylase family protein
MPIFICSSTGIGEWRIVRYVIKKWNVNITYTFEDECNPQGSAGAIREAKKHLNNESFIVTYADILRQLDIGDMFKFHTEKGSPATINSYKRIGPNPKSMIEFDDNRKITAFYERPPANLIQKDYVYANGSFYMFTPEIFDYIPSEGTVDFGKDVFPELIKKEIYTYPTEDYFIDIGTIEKLQQAEQSYPGII